MAQKKDSYMLPLILLGSWFLLNSSSDTEANTPPEVKSSSGDDPTILDPLVNPNLPPSTPTPTDFINQFTAAATATQNKYQVPAAFTLGQAGLESGWGKISNTDGSPTIYAYTNNAFGMTAGSKWTGATYTSTTKKDPSGKYYVYRKYASVQDSFDDHAKMLAGSSRYSSAFSTSDPIQFGNLVAKDGYNSDPAYPGSLAAVITMVQQIQAGQ